jgi:ribosome-associated protein
MNHDDADSFDHESQPPSKSQLKRDAEALQVLGRTLVELPASRFAAVMAKLDLPDALREALGACRAINARGGRKRQLQYIGKLMRGTDAEPIRRALDVLEGKDRAQTAALHRMEQWRERLIAEGDAALAELLNEFPVADRQALRQLVMKARKERDAGQAPAAARALFKALRELFDENHGGHGEEE